MLEGGGHEQQKYPVLYIVFLAFVFVTGVGYFTTIPNPEATLSVDKTWMRFEKTQLQGVLIEKPDGEVLTLRQKDDHWTVQSNSMTEPRRASKTMLNRIKHQLHELDFRENSLFPQTKSWKHMAWDKSYKGGMQLLGEQEQSLLVGDLNPSKVSYFVQYGDGEDRVVHTVKKSSMDMFLQSVDAFRESRIIHMDMRSLSQLTYESKQDVLYYRKEKERLEDTRRRCDNGKPRCSHENDRTIVCPQSIFLCRY